MSDFYISRNLVVEEQTYNEEQLIQMGSLFLVLAEPGAGKTELLSKLGQLLGATPMRASVFRNKTFAVTDQGLVIDAMDEVARVDPLGVEGIVMKASEVGNGTVIFAGRSSEWDTAETEHVRDYFGAEPVVVRLEPFSSTEQRQLFAANFPDENFDAFIAECTRFELDALLGNPQFLLLFGEAFIQSGRHFVSKKDIYRDAVKRLAHEANARVKRPNRPSDDEIAELACEVFVKLMLSGTVGVTTTESLTSQDFHYLRSLVAEKPENAGFLADTRLLKPGDEPGRHEPVHRIVAEYCAAVYLAKRIDVPADRLSLARVLSVVAPKGAVRTELRGMLGWMAALAQEPTQRRLIELDPYAVVANGDPSEFTTGSKRVLLRTLASLADTDPLFRRSDAWRRFNVGTFFTADIRDDVAALIAPMPSESPVRDLVLELLSSSHAAEQFETELRNLAMHGDTRRDVRKAAYTLLIEDTNYDPRSDLSALLAENSRVSLELAATAVRIFRRGNVDAPTVNELLRKLSGLYPKPGGGRDRDRGSRYFIKMMVDSLGLPTIAAALDDLTTGLTCTCDAKHEWQCTCRSGISTIVGLLLDRYLPDAPDLTPEQVWGWTRPLVFFNDRSGSDSPAVKFLSANPSLRQAVHRLAISGLEGEQAKEVVQAFFNSYCHGGIMFHSGDLAPLASHAFDQSNIGA